MKKLILMFMLVFSLSACSLPGLGGSAKGNDVVIASGNTTERQIMAEMIAQMIHHYEPDINVDILTNLGSSVLIQQAMLRNDANISSVMYTGTSLTGELNQEATTNVEEAFTRVVKGYSKEFNMVWFPSYGFDNTYAFMVSQAFAQKHNVEKISDLENIAQDIRAGIDTGWLDRDGDGYEAFKELYGFDFGSVNPMEIGLVYNAIQS
ncbi:MAG TPA: glycine betaine ABC transporter substrate-binding protein, partial [Erysipelothrix sp.]|nr:glycine betaine ABC transporter substrate-binding protein [Erysipelothrix sp.]